jgi:hypothetical protein
VRTWKGPRCQGGEARKSITRRSPIPAQLQLHLGVQDQLTLKLLPRMHTDSIFWRSLYGWKGKEISFPTQLVSSKKSFGVNRNHRNKLALLERRQNAPTRPRLQKKGESREIIPKALEHDLSYWWWSQQSRPTAKRAGHWQNLEVLTRSEGDPRCQWQTDFAPSHLRVNSTRPLRAHL